MKNIVYLFFSILLVLSGCKEKTAIEYFESGNSKGQLKDYKGAIDEYTKAIRADSKYAEAYYMRGKASHEYAISEKDVKLTEDFLAKANADIDIAIEINPKFINAYKTRAQYKLNMVSNDIKAMVDYNIILELDPKDVEYYKLRGKLKGDVLLLRDFRGAIEDYSKAIEINPNDVDAYYWRAENKLTLNDFKGAVEDYTKIIKLNSDNGFYYRIRGEAKFKMNNFKGAIEDYTKAIDRDSKDNAAYYDRGLANIKLGQKDNGCMDLSKSGELGNENAYTAIQKYCN